MSNSTSTAWLAKLKTSPLRDTLSVLLADPSNEYLLTPSSESNNPQHNKDDAPLTLLIHPDSGFILEKSHQTHRLYTLATGLGINLSIHPSLEGALKPVDRVLCRTGVARVEKDITGEGCHMFVEYSNNQGGGIRIDGVNEAIDMISVLNEFVRQKSCS